MRIALSTIMLLSFGAPAFSALPCPADAPAVALAYVRGDEFGRCEIKDLTSSDWMEEARYCVFEGRRVLFVRLQRPKSPTYMYEDVPPEMWDEFRDAASFGQFLNRRIKPTFACLKSDPAD